MSTGYTVTTLADLVGYEEEGRPKWHMIRSTLDIGAFGINAWTATADEQELIGEHDETFGGAGEHEELYLVISGHATFTVDGATLEAPAGTVVFVADPALERGAVATNGTTILVVGAKRGAPFTVSPWERNAEALRFWTTQEWDKAIAVLEGMRAEKPDSGTILYNLACAEARAGLSDAALGHLAEPVALESRFGQLARTDPDLVSIQDDPRFLQASG